MALDDPWAVSAFFKDFVKTTDKYIYGSVFGLSSQDYFIYTIERLFTISILDAVSSSG